MFRGGGGGGIGGQWRELDRERCQAAPFGKNTLEINTNEVSTRHAGHVVSPNIRHSVLSFLQLPQN